MGKSKHPPPLPPVKISYSFLKILTGSDLSLRRLPRMSAVSANPGPVLWLTACGHGDEVCGIVIIQEVFKMIRRKLLRGAIHAFPLMNPIGFETGSRNITVSREDLNRSFPGDAAGSLGKRIADRIFAAIMETSPALVIDLHNDWTKSMPYLLMDPDPESADPEVYESTIRFARRTGFVVVEESEALTTSLSYNLLRKGVPSFTLELGEPFLINEKNVEHGLGAVSNVLANLEMIEPPPTPFRYPAPPVFGEGALLRYSDKPASSKTGIIRFLAKPGDVVRKDQAFARIVNAFGKHQESVKATDDAIVLGHSDSSVVFPGMPIMAFGMVRTSKDSR